MKHLSFFLLLLISLFSCKKEAQECPKNYTGSNCDQEVKPGRVRITRIQLTNYPAKNNGAQWDVNSIWADPYFQISDLNGVVFESGYLDEKQPASISQWDVDLVLVPDSPVVIVFYDEDGSSDTHIDSSVLYYYIEGRGFPDRYTFDGIDGSQISVFVTYEY